MSVEHGVAVIGLGALFPGAADVQTYWENILGGVDCIDELPESRSPSRFCDPSSTAVDRIPTRRAGSLGDFVNFAAASHGVMPVAAKGAEPDQMLALAVASAALADAGYADRDFARDTTAVILGRGGYLTSGLLRLNQSVREAEQVISVLRDVLPGVSEQQLKQVKERFQKAAGPYGPDTAIGLVPNLTASRIANRLDLGGAAYTVDAACASSLLAVEHGVRQIRSGQSELALVGGVHLTHDINFHSVFAQLGALSTSGMIRPFDRRADGLLIGEGIGILVLKDLARARADADRIYAVIAGTGSSSDGRGSSVMVPRVSGQVLALRRAWSDAGIDLHELGLIEAHGTGTSAGDAAELRTLREVFGDGPAVLGSVKSQIGHTMPAAGAAGLIKAVLSVYHGVLPPSLHCEEPHELLVGTEWEVLSKPRPWEGTRVAGVNAFGFGGINAHIVVAQAGEIVPAIIRPKRPADRADAPVLALAAASPAELLTLLDSGRVRGGKGPCRLVVIDPTPKRRARAREVVVRGKPWTGRRGMWYRSEGLLPEGKVVFVYPGIEAAFAPQVEALAARLNLYVPPFMEPKNLEETGLGVVGLARFLTKITNHLGLRPELCAGHSIGEWSAMIATGVLKGDDVDAFLQSVPMGSLEVPGVLFAAAGCGRARAERAMEGLEGIAISHDNCPHQVLLCGHDEPIQIAQERLVKDGVMCQILPFKSGFHSPLFQDYLGPHQQHFARLPIHPATIPLYSATLADRFPDDPDTIRQVALDHLVMPLRWTELINKLYDDGGRVFIQIGTGSLTGFIRDTLTGRPHHAMTLIEPRRDGLVQLRNVLLALFVEGMDAAFEPLVPDDSASIPLALGAPLVHIKETNLGTASVVPSTGSEAIRTALNDTLAALQRGPLEVVTALSARRTATERRILSVETVPALLDHSFFPQPKGWGVVSDGHPVVPMTMTLKLLVEIASQLAEGLVPVEITEVEALRWLIVYPPVEVELRARREGSCVRAEIVGYASAKVRFARDWPKAKPSLLPLENPVEVEVSPVDLYAERFMFHGPRYQGVTTLGPIDATGLDGVITVPEGPGSLLDNAGQLLGYWLMHTEAADQLAMPVGMKSVKFFGPDPGVGEKVVCKSRILELGSRSLVGDVELSVGDQLYCRIERWADHRFRTDPAVWDVMRKPEHNTLSEAHGRFWVFDDQAKHAPSRDWLMRRYMAQAEREELSKAGAPRQLLNNCIARKDAVRALCWEEGSGPLFPVETPTEGVYVSVRGVGAVSVAIASRQPVGIGLHEDPAVALTQARAAYEECGGSDPDVVEVATERVLDFTVVYTK